MPGNLAVRCGCNHSRVREAVMPQRRLIVLLGSIVAIGPLSIDTYLPAFPSMSRSLDASASAVQLTLTACLAGLAPDVLTLTGLRFVQGFAGAAGLVIAQAVVRDMHSGAAAVRLFSSLMLIIGVAPILAPVLGG